MRWADLDTLNHVNNVVYLDYAAEARAVLVDEGALDGGPDIVSMTVKFLRPMRLGRTPVRVTSTVEGATLTQQIGVDAEDSTAVFAKVTTQFGQRQPIAPRQDVAAVSMSVRRSDLDPAGAVTPTKVFELFQESRVLHISTHLGAMTPGSFVVGTSSVTLRTPITWRAEPYEATVWVSRVGRGSFEIRSELSDGVSVLADSTTVLVGFDAQTQRSRPFGDDERAQLSELVRD